MSRQPLSAARKRPFRPFWPALLVVALVLQACSMPQIDLNALSTTPRPTLAATLARPQAVTQAETPVPQQDDQPVEQPPDVLLPPALVEVDPLPGSELRPGDQPVFYFNQPMDRDSVEAAFAAQPEQDGRLEWVDDATLRYIPLAQAAAQGLEITVGAGARSAGGLALPDPVAVRYQAAGPLRVAERLPAEDAVEVNPSAAIAVTFNRPVVALGASEQDAPAAFRFEPEPPGRGEWINTSAYIFYPEPALAGGVSYTVHLNPDLVSAAGAGLADDQPLEWSFTTAAPELLSIQPSTEQPVPLDSAFTLTFNQPMDRASVEGAFSLRAADGSPQPGAFHWDDSGAEVRFQPQDLLQRDATYTLALSGTAQSLGGAALDEDLSAVIVTVPQFALAQTRPAAGEVLTAYQGYGTIVLQFTSPVAPGQELDRLITLNPPVADLSIHRDFEGTQVFVSGFFQPGSSYTLTVSEDLRDRWDAALDVPFSITFSTQDAAPGLVIPLRQAGASALFLHSGEAFIPARGTNISQLDLRRGALSIREFIRAASDPQGLVNWQSLVQEEWPLLLNQAENVSEDIDIPLKPDWTPLNPGLYFLKIDPQPEPSEGERLPPLPIVVSPLQMALKISSRQAFVWVVRSANQVPVAEAVVTIYDDSAAQLASCTTDQQGRCQVALPEQENLFRPFYAVTGRPGEDSFGLASSSWQMGITPWEFNLPYDDSPNEPEVYLYTDRPIYRPGQAINLRLIARAKDNARYAPLPVEQLTVEVVSPYDPFSGQSQVLATLPMTLDRFGSASGSYRIPEDARPGTYFLRVREVPFEEITIEVAAYRKPEIDLQVQFTQPDGLIGDDLQAGVQARYFFGAPAGGLPVRWSLFRSDAIPDLPAGFRSGPLDLTGELPWIFGGLEVYVMEGQAQTGPDGSLALNFSGEELVERIGAQPGQTVALELEVTVEDASGAPVSNRASIRLHPAAYHIAVRPEAWSVSAGEEMTYTVRALDWQAAPLADQPLSARFRKVIWRQTSDFGGPRPAPTYQEVGSTDFRTSAAGEARLAFIPLEPGTYLLEVTGSDGAVTQVLTWVGGPGAALWPDLPNQRLELRSDRQSPSGEPGRYRPGETARIFIPNPFEESALALVTVERAQVMSSSVITINGASHELELPVTADYAPNVYVSVLLLGRSEGRPDFRMGYIELAVDPAGQLLQVDVQASPEDPQPGGELALTIRVRDAEGNPVQGQFSLALIDKAVLALADPNTLPIEEEFYGRQPLGVQNGLSLAVYAGRLIYTPPGRGGGGGADVPAAAPLREQFEDTAYWNGAIETDVTGVARVTLTLPDNLTTWRADVRGLNEETLVGQAQLDLQVSKPLLVVPTVPRFVVAGDHVELAAVVHNNSPSPLNVSVRLETSGFSMDDPDQAVQPVELQPGEQRRVAWWGTVQEIPVLDLAFSAEAWDGETTLSDVTRPENNPLPVLRYLAPQTFATAGVLPEAGERLELVSLPRSFTPSGGTLRLELSPSLAAAVVEGLEALEEFPADFTEPVLSRLLPNLATLQLINAFQLADPGLQARLQAASISGVERLQNEDGGWGWVDGAPSDPYLSSYALFGLSSAAQVGIFVDPGAVQAAQNYLAAELSGSAPPEALEPWRLDRQAFQYFALIHSGRRDSDLSPLFGQRERLSPWGKALLALAIETLAPGDPGARILTADLAASASRTATGASWQDPNPGWRNWSSPVFTTAVTAYALARIEPDSAVLVDAVRYLTFHRRPNGAWASSYETAWVLLAMVESARAAGDLQANFDYTARLNDSPLAAGQVENAGQAVTPLVASVSLSALQADRPNALVIGRGEGQGRLYYRAYLEASRPVEQAPAVQRGLAIERQYLLAGQDCRSLDCPPLDTFDLANPQPVQVRLTLTVPEDMYYVVVEDYLPAGAEVLNPRLKTAQKNIPPVEMDPGGEPGQDQPYEPEDPFREGWGWWRFNDPQVYDDHVRWVVDFLPAGTYELTYRLTPLLAGEFRVLPARAWQYYFPEVEGANRGEIIIIR